MAEEGNPALETQGKEEVAIDGGEVKGTLQQACTETHRKLAFQARRMTLIKSYGNSGDAFVEESKTLDHVARRGRLRCSGTGGSGWLWGCRVNRLIFNRCIVISL